MPRAMNDGFVTRMSSPTSWTFEPRRAVSSRQPAQSSSARPSSSDTIGYLSTQLAHRSTSSPESSVRPSRSSRYCPGTPSVPVPSTRIELVAGSRARAIVLARPVAGLLDRPEDDLDGRLVRRQRRGEPALVALADREAAVVEDPLESVEHLRPGPDRLAERVDPDRGDHELLEVGRVDGVLAAVEDVEERDRQDPARRPRRDSGTAAGRTTPRRRGRRRATRRGSRSRRGWPCSASRRGRSARRRSPAGPPRPRPRARGRSSR